ncbi:MAG: patatin family protein [Prevotella sp.]|nr:patatin family protein [Prevotella sp.]
MGTTGCGLVLEGGAFRGLFTMGVCDMMMQHDLWPEALVGVSAGAAFGCNYKSRQPGRALRYNKRFAHDRRYSGWHSLLTTGNYFNAEFAYHTMPRQLDVFDTVAYEANPMRFIVVCTNAATGEAVYRELPHPTDDAFDWIRASASMPIVSRVVELEGMKLLDGGAADSIPLQYMEQQGWRRNVVILTQPRGFVKQPTPFMPLLRLALRRYPLMADALAQRHVMYNQQLSYVSKAEQQGRCLVISPPEPIKIAHLSHDATAMQRVYDMGVAEGKRRMADIIRFMRGGGRRGGEEIK